MTMEVQVVLTGGSCQGLSISTSHGWQDAWAKSMTLLRSVIDAALRIPAGPILLYTAKLIEQCVLMFTNPSEATNPSKTQRATCHYWARSLALCHSNLHNLG